MVPKGIYKSVTLPKSLFLFFLLCFCSGNRGQVVDVERGYQPPAARSFHAAVADEEAGRLYVLGGYNAEVKHASSCATIGALFCFRLYFHGCFHVLPWKFPPTSMEIDLLHFHGSFR